MKNYTIILAPSHEVAMMSQKMMVAGHAISFNVKPEVVVNKLLAVYDDLPQPGVNAYVLSTTSPGIGICARTTILINTPVSIDTSKVLKQFGLEHSMQSHPNRNNIIDTTTIYCDSTGNIQMIDLYANNSN